MREALRLMEQQDQLRLLQFEQLRRDIQDGLASGEAEVWNPKAIKAEGRRRLGVILIQGWACESEDERGLSA